MLLAFFRQKMVVLLHTLCLKIKSVTNDAISFEHFYQALTSPEAAVLYASDCIVPQSAFLRKRPFNKFYLFKYFKFKVFKVHVFHRFCNGKQLLRLAVCFYVTNLP